MRKKSYLGLEDTIRKSRSLENVVSIGNSLGVVLRLKTNLGIGPFGRSVASHQLAAPPQGYVGFDSNEGRQTVTTESKSFSAHATVKGAGGAISQCAYNLIVHKTVSKLDRVGGGPISQPAYETEGGNLLFLNGDGEPDQTALEVSGLNIKHVLLMEASNGAHYNIALRGRPEHLNGGWLFEVRQVVHPPF